MPRKKNPAPSWIQTFRASDVAEADLFARSMRVHGHRVRSVRRTVKAFNTAAEVIVVAGWKVPDA